ncbi:hypothetical protein RFI_29512 [Reticulomyxa filosa]|uniref:Uncharacterized protein n=1 Tax=Reticulomyxa filosa TaxID=46433 RepID=X6M183_RETFI|nr:hypothetical protein RFI_29512 [Reticulomyxa filosa]|eukprot:ETO07878.1 hypothetical protein RFI_29512 [Reticulomyxa filosa]
MRRLDNHRPNMPVKNIRAILSALSKSVKSLTRCCYHEYVLPLQDRVRSTLGSMTNVKLRELKKEILSRIFEAMEGLLQREKSEAEVAQITETFQLAMGLCFVFAYAQRLSSTLYEICDRKSLFKWVEENKLLEILFGPKSYPQLIKQAIDILKFICLENVLTVNHLAII